MAFTDKIVLDEFLNGSQMNSKIYQTLLFLQDNNDNGRAYIRVQPLAIFNHAYKICDLVMAEPHPELLLDRLWHRSEEEFLADEVNVVYCCVYVILSFTGSGNTGMVYFLTRLRQKIDYKYLSVFEPLLEEELTDFPALPKSFSKLKAQGAKIDDLNERELFYTGMRRRSCWSMSRKEKLLLICLAVGRAGRSSLWRSWYMRTRMARWSRIPTQSGNSRTSL